MRIKHLTFFWSHSSGPESFVNDVLSTLSTRIQLNNCINYDIGKAIHISIDHLPVLSSACISSRGGSVEISCFLSSFACWIVPKRTRFCGLRFRLFSIVDEDRRILMYSKKAVFMRWMGVCWCSQRQFLPVVHRRITRACNKLHTRGSLERNTQITYRHQYQAWSGQWMTIHFWWRKYL